MTAHGEDDSLRSVAQPSTPSNPVPREQAEAVLRQQTEWLRITLASIGDAVISTDQAGRVTFLNGVAETLTGWTSAAAVGRPLPEVFHIVHERTRQPAANPALRALREGTIVGLANHTVLIARDGTERPIDDSAAPMRDESGAAVGAVLVFRDVSERKRAEEAQARLAAIVESSVDAIVSKTLDGVIRTWNAGAQRLFGWTAAEAVGRSITIIIPPERLDEERMILETLRRGERIEAFETVRRRKDGRKIDISLTVSPLLDGEGAVIGVSKIARDITAQKQAAAVLAQHRARLDYAVQLSGVGFWYCDLPFDELIWDERVKEHFWLAPETPVTIDTFYRALHPDDVEPTRQAIETAIRDRTPYDIDYRTVDPATGGIKWIRALGGTAYAADGSPTRFDGVTVDVTDRKADEQRLGQLLAREREQGRLLREVAHAALTIHSAGSLDSVLRVVAEEARRILGARQAGAQLTSGEDGGRPLTAVVAAPAEHRRPDGAAAVFVQHLAEEVIRANWPLRLTQVELAKQAAARGLPVDQAPASWLAAPFVSRGGSNLGLVQASAKESGEFTENDEAILVQLAHIAAVAIENARLNGELRDQDRRKDEFLALLAHELRNPLAPLRNGLQVLRLAGANSADAERARAMMDRQLGHMVRLIDDLLDVSRISRNKMELRRTRVLLADVVSSAVETARPMIAAAAHDLAVALPPEPIYLDADLTRMAQVFGNLLTNSAKYTEHGGRIWLQAVREGAQAVVRVRDTGIGIPAAALPTIFDMFSQVDRSIERSTGGLGIGLALVKGLVEMHGGTVTVFSAGPGQGSTFTVRLPLAADDAETDPPAEEAPAAGSRRRILVVDDNHDAAQSMAMMLQLLGNDVRTAHDGVSAVAAAERFRPDVILMDLGMPRLNGLDATRRIREQPWGTRVTIIALTGWGQDVDRKQSRLAGCDGHLVKPVHLPDLEKLLAQLAPTPPAK